MVTAYAIVACIVVAIALATTPRPRSFVLIAGAALLWPLTMIAVAVHAYLRAASHRR